MFEVTFGHPDIIGSAKWLRDVIPVDDFKSFGAPRVLSTPSSGCRLRHGPRGRKAGQKTTYKARADLGGSPIELNLQKAKEFTDSRTRGAVGIGGRGTPLPKKSAITGPCGLDGPSGCARALVGVREVTF